MKKNVKKMKQNLEVVKQYLMQQELQFFCEEEAGLIVVGFNDAWIMFRVSDELLDIQVSDCKEVPENVYPEMVAYLNKVNRILKEGHFEVETEQGVSYRITSHVGRGMTLRSSRLEEMLEMGSCVGVWFTGSSKIIDEGLDADEAFEQMWEELLCA